MYMSTPVADGGFVYGFGSKRKGQLFCLDARTGTATWATEGRGGTNAAIQSAGPNLVVLTTDADFIVAAPQSREVSRKCAATRSPDVPTWAHPVVLGRRW